jgi:hypothetical protein
MLNRPLDTIVRLNFKHEWLITMNTLITTMMKDEIMNNHENEQSGISAVIPRFSESEIEQMAFVWSSERSIGDAEQDSQCMYDYAQGMRAMQRLLLNMR